MPTTCSRFYIMIYVLLFLIQILLQTLHAKLFSTVITDDKNIGASKYIKNKLERSCL